MTSTDVGLITAAAVQAIATIVLVCITIFYAISTKRQADANVKMAKEMREQRIVTSRPTIIQRTVTASISTSDDGGTFTKLEVFSHFEIYNAGNGPAIELEISIVNADRKDVISSMRRTLLRSTDVFPVDFGDTLLQLSQSGAKYYLVSEYRGISSSSVQKTWYQTLLPLLEINPSSINRKVYITCGELKFKEVTEKDRINAFRDVRQMEEKP